MCTMKKLYTLLTAVLALGSAAVAQTCSGVPAAGTATATTLVPCGGAHDTLVLTGYSAASGLTFQWMVSNDAATWQTIPGATSPTYAFTPDSIRFYMNVVACPSSGYSDSSNQLRLFYDSLCPCLPVYYRGFENGDAIHQFSVSGYGGTSFSDRVLYPFDYERRPDTINFVQYHDYSGTLILGGSFRDQEGQIWIDYNDNGLFETTEAATAVFADTPGSTAGYNFTIHIPLTADTGIHKMRVRSAAIPSPALSAAMEPCYFSDGSTGATVFYDYGSVWDYYAHIVYFPPCRGTPNPGMVSANSCTACSTDTIVFYHAGTSADSFGLYYQWQYSANDTLWTDIPGASTLPFTYLPYAKWWYRLKVGCAVSGDSAISNEVALYYEPTCPCKPLYSASPDFSYLMSCFATAGSGGTALHDTITVFYGLGAYMDRSCQAPVIILFADSSYADTISTLGYYGTGYYQTAQVWVDFDDDGTFNPAEAVSAIYACRACNRLYPRLAIPSTANPGIHRMRVRYAHSSTTIGYPPVMDPCAINYLFEDYTYGNAFDYLVQIERARPPLAASGNAALTQSGVLSLYPNPANGRVTIVTGAAEAVSISNLYGREVWHGHIPPAGSTIALADWPAGLYLVRTENGLVQPLRKN
ncbi:MAG: T9SS C-terminal target domain-containing protein [Chitinophagia bacterium]|nr:T9SS C-terminal target domain-containing protein [Chitinophagia bacterium]